MASELLRALYLAFCLVTAHFFRGCGLLEAQCLEDAERAIGLYSMRIQISE